MIKDKFEYTLIRPIEYASGGEQLSSDTIEIYAPRAKDSLKLLTLESYLNTAFSRFIAVFSKFSKDESSEEVVVESKVETEKDAEAMYESIEKMLKFGLDEDLTHKIYSKFTKLLESGEKLAPTATIEGELLKKFHIDQIQHVDLRNLLVRYTVDFLSVGL